MNIKELVYQFKLEANKIDSNQSQKLAIPKIIAFLNRGQLQLMLTRYGQNNNYRATLEAIQKRKDEWQRLIVPHKRLDGTEDESNKLFRFDLKKADGYCFLLRCSFKISKGKCEDKDALVTRIVETDDLNIILDNPNTNSNFEWREVNYRLSQDQILAYTDQDFSFTIPTADIDYLRYPSEMDMAGYKRFDGSPSADAECELPIFLQPDIVHEAVLLFKASLGHPDVQLSKMVKDMEE